MVSVEPDLWDGPLIAYASEYKGNNGLSHVEDHVATMLSGFAIDLIRNHGADIPDRKAAAEACVALLRLGAGYEQIQQAVRAFAELPEERLVE